MILVILQEKKKKKKTKYETTRPTKKEQMAMNLKTIVPTIFKKTSTISPLDIFALKASTDS